MAEHHRRSHSGSSQRRRGSGKKKVIITVAVVVLLALAAGVGALLFANNMLNRMNRVKEEEIIAREEQDFETDTEEPDTIEASEVSWDSADVKVMEDQDIENILLIGQDRRPGQGRQRSDSMIICSINKRSNRITLVSLMRDMYVPIPGFDDNRINATYAFGGMHLLNETIEQDFGIHIDGNVEVDFEGFITALTKVGPLDITLRQEEADYINNALGRDDLTAGVNALDAEQALVYARTRKVGDGDYERTDRQRTVLMTAFNKMRSSDIATTYGLAKELLPSLTTDLTNAEMLGLVYTVLTNDMTLSRESYRIPIDGSYSSERIRGMAVIVPDLKANREALKQYLYGLNR